MAIDREKELQAENEKLKAQLLAAQGGGVSAPKPQEFRMDGENDPMECLNKVKCLKGHSAWNQKPGHVIWSIESHAHVVECLECKKSGGNGVYFISDKNHQVFPAPDGWVSQVEESQAEMAGKR